jgi:hypothetical protein
MVAVRVLVVRNVMVMMRAMVGRREAQGVIRPIQPIQRTTTLMKLRDLTLTWPVMGATMPLITRTSNQEQGASRTTFLRQMSATPATALTDSIMA